MTCLHWILPVMKTRQRCFHNCQGSKVQKNNEEKSAVLDRWQDNSLEKTKEVCGAVQISQKFRVKKLQDSKRRFSNLSICQILNLPRRDLHDNELIQSLWKWQYRILKILLSACNNTKHSRRYIKFWSKVSLFFKAGLFSDLIHGQEVSIYWGWNGLAPRQDRNLDNSK